jgi:hypothetical protein
MNTTDEFTDFHKTLKISSVTELFGKDIILVQSLGPEPRPCYFHGLGAGTNRTLMKTMVGNWNRLHGMELNCEAGNEVEFHYLSA